MSFGEELKAALSASSNPTMCSRSFDCCGLQWEEESNGNAHRTHDVFEVVVKQRAEFGASWIEIRWLEAMDNANCA